MKSKTRALVCLFAITLISLNLFLTFTIADSGTPKTSALTDVEYEFESNNLWNSTNHVWDNSTNVKDSELYTGHYNATYSFTGETGLEYPNIEWIDYQLSGYSTEVISYLDGHTEVLNATRIGSASNYPRDYIEDQTYGIVEVWMYATGDSSVFNLGNSTENIVAVIYDRSDVEIDLNYGVSHIHIAQPVDKWFHVKVEFNCSTFLQSVWINGILELDEEAFYLNNNMEHISQVSVAGSLSVTSFWDAFGYFWDDNYTIGDNLIPYSVSNSSIQEIDVYTFSYTEAGVYTTYEAVVPFWDEVYGSDDAHGYERIQNGDLRLFSEDTFNVGVYKDDFTLLDGMIDITLSLEVYRLDVDGGVFYFNIYSEDTTLKTRLRFIIVGSAPCIGTLSYYDGASYNDIYAMVENEVKNLTLTINPSNLIVLKDDSGIIAVYEGIDSNLGLSKFEIIGQAGANGDDVGFGRAIRLDIDWIGIYSNGTSLSNDFMSITANTNINWDSNDYNLFTTEIDGVCSISANNFVLYNAYNYSTTKVYNVWDLFTGGNEVEGWISLRDVYLTFVSNESLALTYVSIGGILLVEGTNEYFPTYTSGSINRNESYWWVSNNLLHYTLTCDDNDTEYIQISFDIIDIATFGNTFMFTGSHFNQFGRELKLNYVSGTTSVISLLYGLRIIRFFYSSEEVFKSFDILITDDDNYDDYEDTGYLTDLIIRPASESGIDISTGNFLTALTPLLFFILTPSLLVIYSLKKADATDELKEKMFTPILAVFCFVAYVFAQVDLWMLFLMIIGFATLFLANSGDS